uniref:Uncharacterized protein n=2 Tax=Cafeteria roenbergensis TaxID=33653 RepID=A0A7S0JQF2_CAFRO
MGLDDRTTAVVEPLSERVTYPRPRTRGAASRLAGGPKPPASVRVVPETGAVRQSTPSSVRAELMAPCADWSAADWARAARAEAAADGPPVSLRPVPAEPAAGPGRDQPSHAPRAPASPSRAAFRLASPLPASAAGGGSDSESGAEGPKRRWDAASRSTIKGGFTDYSSDEGRRSNSSPLRVHRPRQPASKPAGGADRLSPEPGHEQPVQLSVALPPRDPHGSPDQLLASPVESAAARGRALALTRSAQSVPMLDLTTVPLVATGSEEADLRAPSADLAAVVPRRPAGRPRRAAGHQSARAPGGSLASRRDRVGPSAFGSFTARAVPMRWTGPDRSAADLRDPAASPVVAGPRRQGMPSRAAFVAAKPRAPRARRPQPSQTLQHRPQPAQQAGSDVRGRDGAALAVHPTAASREPARHGAAAEVPSGVVGGSRAAAGVSNHRRMILAHSSTAVRQSARRELEQAQAQAGLAQGRPVHVQDGAAGVQAAISASERRRREAAESQAALTAAAILRKPPGPAADSKGRALRSPEAAPLPAAASSASSHSGGADGPDMVEVALQRLSNIVSASRGPPTGRQPGRQPLYRSRTAAAAASARSGPAAVAAASPVGPAADAASPDAALRQQTTVLAASADAWLAPGPSSYRAAAGAAAASREGAESARSRAPHVPAGVGPSAVLSASGAPQRSRHGGGHHRPAPTLTDLGLLDNAAASPWQRQWPATAGTGTAAGARSARGDDGSRLAVQSGISPRNAATASSGAGGSLGLLSSRHGGEASRRRRRRKKRGRGKHSGGRKAAREFARLLAAPQARAADGSEPRKACTPAESSARSSDVWDAAGDGDAEAGDGSSADDDSVGGGTHGSDSEAA